MINNKVLLALSLLVSLNTQAEELLLTGSISSSAKQVVVAPQASRWQIQIQWMEEEGKIVQKGEPVVVFDGASEQTQLLTQQENLDRLELELKQLVIEQEQNVIDAKGSLTVAKMRVDKARIEASVPDSEVSAYDKGQYELALQRALLEQVKAEEAYARAKQEQKAELTKKEVDILKTKEEIAYLNNILGQLRVISEYTGPVSYAIHPWFGEKVAPGMNVRPSWNVVDVQSTEKFQIETWVHELDAIGLSKDTTVEIVLDAYPDRTFNGTIVSLSPQSETRPQWSKSAYFPAIVQFDGLPDVKLQPGMSVRIHVNKEVIDA
ncbi:HlyD family efflux transporter periplasmic adaptor subunit [Alteromonas sediminis]|uniref:HlyD family efflux transporter periplasmic adaptor subunit n=1 Tax=Alteromonas sediminis TaxID=2259342 RepID=A0A3N5YE19_9ALTE|nr:HlyD family efflux transporter periplasmic adaptor subunit [Alteromonas sediminis]RPJ67845.1 HlyD family efflux transporter periplasmic adaptor subunit [Alteromonas sediminis]